jgi:hypothetical protein
MHYNISVDKYFHIKNLQLVKRLPLFFFSKKKNIYIIIITSFILIGL